MEEDIWRRAYRREGRHLEVHGDALFVAVDAHEVSSLTAYVRRPPGARGISEPRLFHFDHLLG